MKVMAQLTQGIIDAAIEGFESQKRRIDKQIAELRALSNGHAPAAESSAPPKVIKSGMSAAGRRAIAEAQPSPVPMPNTCHPRDLAVFRLHFLNL